MRIDGPIFALDIATRVGVAVGRDGDKPRSWAVPLKRPNDEPDVAFATFLSFLDTEWRKERPGLIVRERALDVQALMRLGNYRNVAERTYGLHGIVSGLARRWGIRSITADVSTVRKHFIGKGRLPREEAKPAVVKRCIQLGYLSILEPDEDRADALAIWDWAIANIARKSPSELHLFGETPGSKAAA